MHQTWSTKQIPDFRTGLKRLALLTGLMLLIAACQAAPEPDPIVCERICVDDQFAEFYRAHEGALVFGQPRSSLLSINEGTPEAAWVQFFDSVRLDMDPISGEIAVANLGDWAYAGRADAGETNGARYAVEGAFKAFYDAHQGEALFGPPISPLMAEGDLKVQYFRNVRLEWQPGAPAGRQVVVSSLGQAQLLKEYFEAPLVAQPIDFQLPETVIVEAAVRAPVLYAGDDQILYVTTLQPDRRPLGRVSLRLVVWRGEQAVELTEILTTAADGTARIPLALPDLQPGEEVTIEVFASLRGENPLGSTSVAFETWW